jgi:NADPH:quinone reductase
MSDKIPQHQRAVELTAVGQPLQLNLKRPVPTPSPTQVLVKVLVVGINPHDAKARSYGLFAIPPWTPRPAFPSLVGNDVVGRVVSIGEQVKPGLSVGDVVVSHADLRQLDIAAETSPQHGTQQYAVADPAFLAKVPPRLENGLDAMGSIPTNAIAPLFALFASVPEQGKAGGLGIPAPWMHDVSAEWEQKIQDFDHKGTTVLVVGGGSNCGRWGVQLLKLAGIGRIVVVGGDEQEMKELGATHVIDRHGDVDEVLTRVREVVGNDLLYAYDAVNPPSGQVLAARALSTKTRGRLARLVRSPDADLTKLVENDVGFDLINVLGGSQFNTEIAARFWERIEGWMADGSLRATPWQSDFFQEDWSDAADKVNNLFDRYDRGERVVKMHFHVRE